MICSLHRLQRAAIAALGLWLLAAPGPAHAQSAIPAPEAEELPQGQQPDPALIPPRLVLPATPHYPESARVLGIERDVTVMLTIDASGAVRDATIETPVADGLDEAALAAARRLHFEPARQAGRPVSVQLRYTFYFRLPRADSGAQGPSKLRVQVVGEEHGVGLAGIVVGIPALDQRATTDAAGHAELTLPAGQHQVVIEAAGFYPFLHTETVLPGEQLSARYRLTPRLDDSYVIEVWGKLKREETSRTVLQDEELVEVPGTMGEPIRVIMQMPGVSASLSGLSYPIIRGSLPGESLYEIEGIEVPMLYHFLLGTATLHSRLLDEITFQPGGFSAEHGRAVGGRIAASIAPAPDKRVTELGASLFDARAYHAQPLGEHTSFVLGAKAGTLGLAALIINPNTVLNYADYQARLTYRGDDNSTLSLTVLGAVDFVYFTPEPDSETSSDDGILVGFNRLDARYERPLQRGRLRAGVQLVHDYMGVLARGDHANPGGMPEPEREDLLTQAMGLRPYVGLRFDLSDVLRLDVGSDLSYTNRSDRLFQPPPDDPDASGFPPFDNTNDVTMAGAWAKLMISLPKLTVMPSVRVDHYRYTVDRKQQYSHSSVDPRLSGSYDVTRSVRVKAGAGLYHAPPRLTMFADPVVIGPVPGGEGLGASHGLNRAMHYDAGVEVELPAGLQWVTTAFLHDTHHKIDLGSVWDPIIPIDCLEGEPEDWYGDDWERAAASNVEATTMGAELMLRRRLSNSLFGWVSYTLSRGTRRIPGFHELPTPFDQRHVLNAAMSWKPSKSWTLGASFHAHSGRPITLPALGQCNVDGKIAVPAERMDGFWRVDMRIARRFQYNGWYLDASLDLFNAFLRPEMVNFTLYGDPDNPVLRPVYAPPLFLPMLGVSGVF